MGTMQTIPQRDEHRRPYPRDDQLDRLAVALERLEQRLDQFFGAYLNARFPYGKPTDRWKRSA